jgi:RND family efflux transporter MFP subunit
MFRVVLMLVLTVFLGACNRQPPAAAADKKGRAETATVEKRDLELTIDVVGDLNPSVKVEVKPEVTFRVKKIYVKAGQMVQKGDLLVDLDDTDLLTQKTTAQTEIEGAQLQLEKAKLAAERAKQLVAAELISQEQADNLRLDAEIAKNNLEKARKKLQSVEDQLLKIHIRAPMSGTVIDLPIVEGQVVLGGATSAANTVLMILANLSEMLITVHVNQIDVVRMKEGQPVQVTLDAFEGLVLNGKISFIAPLASVKNNIKGFSVDILVANTDPRIRPGMSANVKVPITKVTGVLAVPVESVFRETGKRVVYRKEGSAFKKTEVEVGIVTTDRTEIKSGLKEGDVISLTPPKEEESKK